MRVFVGMRKALMVMLMRCDALVLIDGESSDYCIAGLNPGMSPRYPPPSTQEDFRTSLEAQNNCSNSSH